jgi:cyclase
MSQYFQVEQVADDVYAAIVTPGTGAWGNAGIIDLGGRTVIFDTFATPRAAADLRAAAEELTGRPVTLVINSHRHIDHVGGNQVFAGAEIIATAMTRELTATRMARFITYGLEHPELVDRMAERAEALTDAALRREAMMELGEFRAIREALPTLTVTLPTLTFETEIVLHGSARTAHLFTPGGGHSASDAVLWLPEDRILFAGDLVQVGFHPSMDDGNPAAWEGILPQLAELAPERIVPGHGPVGDGSSIVALQGYFAGLRAIAAAEHSDGLMPDAYAHWETPSLFADNVKVFADQIRAGSR